MSEVGLMQAHESLSREAERDVTREENRAGVRKSPLSVAGCEDGGRADSQSRAALRSWKTQGNRLSLEPPGGGRPADILTPASKTNFRL